MNHHCIGEVVCVYDFCVIVLGMGPCFSVETKILAQQAIAVLPDVFDCRSVIMLCCFHGISRSGSRHARGLYFVEYWWFGKGVGYRFAVGMDLIRGLGFDTDALNVYGRRSVVDRGLKNERMAEEVLAAFAGSCC